MKLNRSKLKNIVKECLVEILSEGIGVVDKKQIRHNTKQKRLKNAADFISYNESAPANKNHNFENTLDNTVDSITSDPIMASLLKDTAKTTLQEQLNHSSAPTPMQEIGDAADLAAMNLAPDELPGASNWAALAFSDAKS